MPHYFTPNLVPVTEDTIQPSECLVCHRWFVSRKRMATHDHHHMAPPKQRRKVTVKGAEYGTNRPAPRGPAPKVIPVSRPCRLFD